MKTNNLALIAIAALSFLFTSCSEDGLVDSNVAPDQSHRTASTSSSQSIAIISWQSLDIQQPQCPIFSAYSTEGEADNEADLNCLGEYGFNGQGAGYIEGLDRFTVTTGLKFDPMTNTVVGTLNFDFPGLGAELTLRTNGAVNRSGDYLSRDGVTLTIPVEYESGTGIFSESSFEGDLSLMHAEQIFDNEKHTYDATIVIDGTLINE